MIGPSQATVVARLKIRRMELPLVPHKHGASRGLPTVQKEPWFPSP